MTSVIKSPLGDSFEGTYEEHVKYIGLRFMMDGKTLSEWRNRIWDRLMYFQNKKYYIYGEKDYFCAHKVLPIDGQKLFLKCGIAICYSCNKVVYFEIKHLSLGERSVYNGLEGKFIIKRFRNISFNREHWGIYQHWTIACTRNKFCKLNFEEYMEIKQLILLDKWVAFHQYDLQMNQFDESDGSDLTDQMTDSSADETDNLNHLNLG
ncbi:hypothetical protein RhiirA4_473424 [Rhizophagus irregularis]|uniref:Uncharacterized protein n=1 Tax=Rhizophagus irregularis TaxID=588596 RepID=A0A2I1H6Q6_9GLOM|nr:hypothetical protein RhiirA4_473424 [Rhizophagus irregularis]